jgi:hypothetical protein
MILYKTITKAIFLLLIIFNTPAYSMKRFNKNENENENNERRSNCKINLKNLIFDALNNSSCLHAIKWEEENTTFAINWEHFTKYYRRKGNSTASTASIRNRMTRSKTGFYRLEGVVSPPAGFDNVYGHDTLIKTALPEKKDQPIANFPTESKPISERTNGAVNFYNVIVNALNDIKNKNILKWRHKELAFLINWAHFGNYYRENIAKNSQDKSIKNRMTISKTGFAALKETPPDGYDRVYTHIYWLTGNDNWKNLKIVKDEIETKYLEKMQELYPNGDLSISANNDNLSSLETNAVCIFQTIDPDHEQATTFINTKLSQAIPETNNNHTSNAVCIFQPDHTIDEQAPTFINNTQENIITDGLGAATNTTVIDFSAFLPPE